MFNLNKANHVRNFLASYCTHTKGKHAGKPFELMPFQWEEIIRPLFGELKEDGTRQYKRASIWCAKKVGKSTLCAGLSLYMLLADGEASPEVYIIASTIDEAGMIFNQACAFIRANAKLSKLLKTNDNLKTIKIRNAEGFIKVLSGDRPQGKFGVNASCVIGDEVGHASPFQTTIWADLQYSGAARLQPLQITISTSSFDLNGWGYEQFKTAVQVKENPSLDPTLLPVIYAAAITDDPFNPETWRKACPSLGETVSIEDYEQEAKRAKNNTRLLDEFCTYRLCQWRSASSTWIPNHVWTHCKFKLNEADYYGRESFIGLDAGSKHDLFAYCILIKDGEKVILFPRAFIPADNAKRKELQDGVPYTAWAQQGFIHLTAGDVIDPLFVKEKLLEDIGHFPCRELGYDPAAGAELLMIDLRENHGVRTVHVSQSAQALSAATHYFEQLVYKQQIKAAENPVLDWCLNNCVIKRRKDVIHLDKDKASARIDVITGAVIGLNRVLANPTSNAFVLWGD